MLKFFILHCMHTQLFVGPHVWILWNSTRNHYFYHNSASSGLILSSFKSLMELLKQLQHRELLNQLFDITPILWSLQLSVFLISLGGLYYLIKVKDNPTSGTFPPSSTPQDLVPLAIEQRIFPSSFNQPLQGQTSKQTFLQPLIPKKEIF